MALPLEYDGGEIDVFPTRIHPVSNQNRPLFESIEWPLTSSGYLDSKLRLNEVSFQLIRGYMEKYLDKDLLPLYRDIELDGDSFDDYGDNLYHYSDLLCMFEEIRNAARDISLDKETDTVRQMIPLHILCYFGGRGRTDKEQLFEELRADIADYMLRFCDAIQSVMDQAPEFDLLDFQGP